MLALITGGTNGIGLAIAEEFLQNGHDVLLVSRSEGHLEELKKKYPTRLISFISHDLTKEEECYQLLKETEQRDISFFIANAGFGDISHIDQSDIKKDVDMVKLNDISTLILGKTFLNRFIKKGNGRVMFVSSAASFAPAPYMSCYYASKVFVYYLVHGYHRELKHIKSKVTISALCPGPVKTDFEKRANVKFNIFARSPSFVAKKAYKGLLKGRLTIVPGFEMKCLHFLSHLFPKRLITVFLKRSATIVTDLK